MAMVYGKAPTLFWKGEIIMSKKLREDEKGRELYKGETQRKDGSYVYKYIGADGKPKYE